VVVVAATSPAPRRSAELEPQALTAAIAGESWAFRELVRCYQRRVHGLVWRMLGSLGRRTLAEDVTQEVFLRAFRALPRFEVRGETPLSSWLLAIAARTAIDELRKRRLSVAPLDVVAPPPARAAGPDEVASWASTARAVERAAAELAPEIRAAFILRAYHEQSYAEIAVALDIDLGTVKSRLHRARKALSEQLGEHDHD
jgi:RNA polymerase sigma-70 factor (ECF subfamily)